ETDAAGHEERRDKYAEPDRLELQAELRVGHHLVAVDQRQHRTSREGAEDCLESDVLSQGDKADQQDERTTHADLGSSTIAGRHRRGGGRRARWRKPGGAPASSW